jgi:DNA invertase Pin-like site-specific DNA recombinase
MSGLFHWVVWLLVGAMGAVLAVLAVVAVGHVFRRRRRRAAPIASSQLPRGTAVLGYVTIAPDAGDDDSRSSAAISAACKASGWRLVDILRDVDEGSTLARAGLHSALKRIREGRAQALVVSDLEPFSRSIADLGALMSWFREADAALITLDPELDTSTPEGQRVAATLIALGAREHERGATGTRSGLANGRVSGRPAVSDRPELVERIAAMRAANMTLSAIADQLNAEGVPTLRGGQKWRPSSIQAALGYRRPDPRDRLPSPRG